MPMLSLPEFADLAEHHRGFVVLDLALAWTAGEDVVCLRIGVSFIPQSGQFPDGPG